MNIEVLLGQFLEFLQVKDRAPNMYIIYIILNSFVQISLQIAYEIWCTFLFISLF